MIVVMMLRSLGTLRGGVGDDSCGFARVATAGTQEDDSQHENREGGDKREGSGFSHAGQPWRTQANPPRAPREREPTADDVTPAAGTTLEGDGYLMFVGGGFGYAARGLRASAMASFPLASNTAIQYSWGAFVTLGGEIRFGSD